MCAADIERVAAAVASEHVFEDQFLLQQEVPGVGEVLTEARHFGLRPFHLDGSKRADLHLRAVVLQQLLGDPHRVLFDFDILVQADQIPVEPDHRGYGADHLLVEDVIGDALVVPGDADVAAVDGHAENPAAAAG